MESDGGAAAAQSPAPATSAPPADEAETSAAAAQPAQTSAPAAPPQDAAPRPVPAPPAATAMDTDAPAAPAPEPATAAEQPTAMDTDAPVPAAPAPAPAPADVPPTDGATPAAAMDTDAPAPAAPPNQAAPPPAPAPAPPKRVRLQTDGEDEAPLATMDTPEGAEVRIVGGPQTDCIGKRGLVEKTDDKFSPGAVERTHARGMLVIGVYNMGRRAIKPEFLKVVAAPLPKVVEKKPEVKPKPKPRVPLTGALSLLAPRPQAPRVVTRPRPTPGPRWPIDQEIDRRALELNPRTLSYDIPRTESKLIPREIEEHEERDLGEPLRYVEPSDSEDDDDPFAGQPRLWHKAWCHTSNRTYYYDLLTRDVSWIEPHEFDTTGLPGPPCAIIEPDVIEAESPSMLGCGPPRNWVTLTQPKSSRARAIIKQIDVCGAYIGLAFDDGRVELWAWCVAAS